MMNESGPPCSEKSLSSPVEITSVLDPRDQDLFRGIIHPEHDPVVAHPFAIGLVAGELLRLAARVALQGNHRSANALFDPWRKAPEVSLRGRRGEDGRPWHATGGRAL